VTFSRPKGNLFLTKWVNFSSSFCDQNLSPSSEKKVTKMSPIGGKIHHFAIGENSCYMSVNLIFLLKKADKNLFNKISIRYIVDIVCKIK
jgi:hypothetical protein